AVGHAVQPAAQGQLAPQGSRLAGQDQEGRLEGVLGLVPVAENALANGEDHGPVPPQQGGEGVAVPGGQEAVQQLPVGQSAALQEGGAVEVPQRRVHRSLVPPCRGQRPPTIMPAGPAARRTFLRAPPAPPVRINPGASGSPAGDLPRRPGPEVLGGRGAGRVGRCGTPASSSPSTRLPVGFVPEYIGWRPSPRTCSPTPSPG